MFGHAPTLWPPTRFLRGSRKCVQEITKCSSVWSRIALIVAGRWTRRRVTSFQGRSAGEGAGNAGFEVPRGSMACLLAEGRAGDLWWDVKPDAQDAEIRLFGQVIALNLGSTSRKRSGFLCFV